MYSLNRYSSQEKQYNDENGALIFGGRSLPYSDILPYERAKGKIILLSEFTESYPNNIMFKFMLIDIIQNLYSNIDENFQLFS